MLECMTLQVAYSTYILGLIHIVVFEMNEARRARLSMIIYIFLANLYVQIILLCKQKLILVHKT